MIGFGGGAHWIGPSHSFFRLIVAQRYLLFATRWWQALSSERLAHRKWSRDRKKVPRASFPEPPFGYLRGSPVFHAFFFPTATARIRQARHAVGAVFRLVQADYFLVPVVVPVVVQQRVVLAVVQRARADAVGVPKGFLSPTNRHLEVVAKHLPQSHVCWVLSAHSIYQRSRPGRGWRACLKDRLIPISAARTMVLNCLK